MLQVTISAKTVESLCDQIQQLADSLVPYGYASVQMQAEEATLAELADDATQEPPEAEANEEPTPEPEAPQEAKDEPQGPTAEEVRAALNKLRKTKGYDAVKNILTAHGSDNFPGLDKIHYAAVMKEAEADAAD